MTTKEQIVELLITNDRAVIRAVIVLNQRQTLDEQQIKGTKNRNGQGFTPADAHMGTSMAEFAERTGRLTERQIAYWRKPNARGVPRICKYAGQLLEVARARAAQTQEAV